MTEGTTPHKTLLEASLRLSSRGVLRRDAILALAHQAARQRRRRRRILRSTPAVAALLAISVSVVLALCGNRPTGRSEVVSMHPRDLPAPQRRPRSVVTIARVRTEPGIAARLAVPAASGGDRRLPRISDDELLARLAEAGRPAGLAYVDDRPVLVFHDRGRGSAAGGVSQ